MRLRHKVHSSVVLAVLGFLLLPSFSVMVAHANPEYPEDWWDLPGISCDGIAPSAVGPVILELSEANVTYCEIQTSQRSEVFGWAFSDFGIFAEIPSDLAALLSGNLSDAENFGGLISDRVDGLYFEFDQLSNLRQQTGDDISVGWGVAKLGQMTYWGSPERISEMASNLLERDSALNFFWELEESGEGRKRFWDADSPTCQDLWDDSALAEGFELTTISQFTDSTGCGIHRSGENPFSRSTILTAEFSRTTIECGPEELVAWEETHQLNFSLVSEEDFGRFSYNYETHGDDFASGQDIFRIGATVNNELCTVFSGWPDSIRQMQSFFRDGPRVTEIGPQVDSVSSQGDLATVRLLGLPNLIGPQSLQGLLQASVLFGFALPVLRRLVGGSSRPFLPRAASVVSTPSLSFWPSVIALVIVGLVALSFAFSWPNLPTAPSFEGRNLFIWGFPIVALMALAVVAIRMLSGQSGHSPRLRAMVVGLVVLVSGAALPMFDLSPWAFVPVFAAVWILVPPEKLLSNPPRTLLTIGLLIPVSLGIWIVVSVLATEVELESPILQALLLGLSALASSLVVVSLPVRSEVGYFLMNAHPLPWLVVGGVSWWVMVTVTGMHPVTSWIALAGAMALILVSWGLPNPKQEIDPDTSERPSSKRILTG